MVILKVLDSISRTKGERKEVKRKGEERKEGEREVKREREVWKSPKCNH